MLVSLIIIIITNIACEKLLEKLNQTKLEPFEKIQAKTRYIKNRKVWRYITLLGVCLVGAIISLRLNIGFIGTNVILGVLAALVNTIFENTFFDKMRNTLR